MKKKILSLSNFLLASIILTVFAFSVFLPEINNEVQVVAPIYNGENKNNVSLMVNVYGGNEYLEQMLEVFKKNEIKTTFFVGGCWAEKNVDLLKQIKDLGHEIGNHGYFHKDHKKINAKRNSEEISACHNLIKQLLGVEMNLFAPPSGSFSDTTLNVANSFGYKTIMWSRDTIDWRDQDCALIIKRATQKTVGGDLILMHPTNATAQALQSIIEELTNKNLVITTVSKVIEQN